MLPSFPWLKKHTVDDIEFWMERPNHLLPTHTVFFFKTKITRFVTKCQLENFFLYQYVHQTDQQKDTCRDAYNLLLNVITDHKVPGHSLQSLHISTISNTIQANFITSHRCQYFCYHQYIFRKLFCCSDICKTIYHLSFGADSQGKHND